MSFSTITGWGKYLPPAVLTNQDLATFLDTSDEWIKTRTGISERRIAHIEMAEMATRAAKSALSAADISADEVDFIILATATPSTLIPNSASAVQQSLGATKAAVFDMNAACTGFLYGLTVGDGLIKSGGYKKGLVIGAEKLTYFQDWAKRDTSVLFGDGAGAVVLEATDREEGLLASKLGCDSEDRDILIVPDWGSSADRFAPTSGFYRFIFEGREIFKRAVRRMKEAAFHVMEQKGLSADDIDLVIPHQANLRIIETLAKGTGINMDKVMVNIAKYGNTSAATVPIALCEALESGRIKPEQYILSAAFGAGLTWGACLLRWGNRVEPINDNQQAEEKVEKTALELLKGSIDACCHHSDRRY